MITGGLVATSGALLGSFLLLRRMSMLGDAISHAVLPGLVLAYLISGSRASLPMMVGAAATGLLCTWFIQWLKSKARLQADGAIGITYTWLFAIGAILVTAFSRQIDIDQQCVLYGELAYVPLQRWVTPSGTDFGPRDTWILAFTTFLSLSLVTFGYRGFRLTSFDEGYARSRGVAIDNWHYLLMGAVSLFTVSAFESVGAILVVSFLVGPAAAAYLLTNRLDLMLTLGVLLGWIGAVLGYLLSVVLDVNIAGAMATTIAVEVALSIVVYQAKGTRPSYKASL